MFTVCFAVSLYRGSAHPKQQDWPAKLLPQELHSAPQHQATVALNWVCEHLCFILICFVPLFTRCVLRYQKSLIEVILGGLGELKNFSIWLNSWFWKICIETLLLVNRWNLYAGNICTFSSVLLWMLNYSKKQSINKKYNWDTTSIKHYSGSPGQVNKTRKINKWHMNWKGRSKTSNDCVHRKP